MLYASYLCALKNVNVVAIYTLNSLVEIVYEHENTHRSVSVNFRVSGGSMGYVASFTFDSIPLPPAKKLHSLSGVIQHILHVNVYVSSEPYMHTEELEFVCQDGRYLFYFDAEEEDGEYYKIVKDKAPSLQQIEYPKVACLPKELFCVETFKGNLAFALNAHKEQKTPHGLPYSMHLLSVASEVIVALGIEPLSFDENNVAIACALLHDVNEDTQLRISKESAIFGHAEVIAKGVAALTKDKTLSTKKAQMEDSLKRLKERQNCVALVKLADRITNLGEPPAHWDGAKKAAYVEEAKLILEHLGYAHGYLARKLASKIEAYERYM